METVMRIGDRRSVTYLAANCLCCITASGCSTLARIRTLCI